MKYLVSACGASPTNRLGSVNAPCKRVHVPDWRLRKVSHYGWLVCTDMRCCSDGAVKSTDTLADVCGDVYCSSLEECSSAGSLATLEGGRAPWEGRLTLRINLASDQVFESATLRRNLRQQGPEIPASLTRISTTVCADNWTYQDALVACRAMGFSDVLQHSLKMEDSSNFTRM